MRKTILALSVVALLASCTNSSTETKSTCDTCVVKTDSTKISTDSTKISTDSTAKKDTVKVKVD